MPADIPGVRRLPIICLLLLLAPAAAAQVHGGGGVAVGEVQRHVDIVYYEVEGRTAGELARSLQQRGPTLGGKRFFGQTDWTINAAYEWHADVTGCRVQNLVVRLLVRITLPRWTPPPTAPQDLVAAWNRFVRALAAHEHNHRRLADEAAEAIRWDLATLRYASCATAAARAQKRVAAIIEDYSRRNRLYDARTSHGATEGAVWPPAR